MTSATSAHSTDVDAQAPNGNASGNHDHDIRSRKPQHAQVRGLTRELSNGYFNGTLTEVGDGVATRLTSGLSTPLADDAPQSLKTLSVVRQQVRAEQKRRRIFPTIDYTSRVSHFDPESDYRDFHGFFNLFWIGLAIMAFTSGLRNIKDTGYPMRLQIWSLFTHQTWDLAIADFLMVGSTCVSLPMHKWFRSSTGVMSWHKGGMALQSVYQVVWLSVWIAVPFLLNWTWTAQVFLILHSMVLLMKMHSFAFYSGHLSETEKRLHALDHPSTASKAPAEKYPGLGKPVDDMVSMDNDTKSSASDQDIQDLAQLREDLARELTSPIGNVTYPRNLTWANYFDYLLCPTLCYELEYPRNPKINWTSLAAKVVATFGCIFLLTVISEEFILPVLQESRIRLETAGAAEVLLVLAETISWLLFPFMLTFLLVFLVIFEYILGAFADMTCFADRHFYADWWNSTDWMEFSREWNVPVYSFLRRHVYATTRPRIGRKSATLITFLISAFMHEVVLACITKKLRGYGFMAQMTQLPIVMIQRSKWVKGRKTANNVMFWISIMIGISLICSLYVLM